jgi:FkbM family methyltransferase
MLSDLVFDVGMNNGDDTAYYLHRGHRVVAIEADPTMVEEARGRFAEEIRTGRLQLLNVAIGPRDEVADFWICDEKRVWNSFDRSVASRDGLPHHAIPVRCRPFRDLLAEYGTPLYLKIDIEGHDHYCLDALDPRDLPRYISLEMGPFELLFRLQELGYIDFKFITQNDHSQLYVDVFSDRAHVKRRMREHPALYAMGRRLSAAWPVRRFDNGAAPDGCLWNGSHRNGWHFPLGSSGPFGEDTPGKWQSIEDAAFTWTAYQLGQSQYGPPHLNIWHDVHARLGGDR